VSAPPYSIGSDVLPGLSRLAEEAGEVVQVIGKILGAGHLGTHFDGTDLRQRLLDELADLTAAVAFVGDKNVLPWADVEQRAERRYRQFCEWHEQWSAGVRP
jgi:NTP pyrophosphatase (non-canonical NTP hydrolase)